MTTNSLEAQGLFLHLPHSTQHEVLQILEASGWMHSNAWVAIHIKYSCE